MDKPPKSTELRESIVQYKAYLDLSPNLPPKELERINKKITTLGERANKLEQKEKAQAAKPARK
jgi:hypothetical protein